MAKHREALAVALNHSLATGMSPREAKRAAKELVQDAEAAAQGQFGEGSGEMMLQRLKAEPDVYQARLNEGVRDTDVRNFYDKGAVYQHVMTSINELDRGVMFMQQRREAKVHGATDEEAAAVAGQHVRSRHPIYGDPSDGDGPDAPIYPELRERIDRMLAPRLQINPGALLAELDTFSSFNAWARSQLAARS